MVYGVMVALRFLVPSVKVRVLVDQHYKLFKNPITQKKMFFTSNTMAKFSKYFGLFLSIILLFPSCGGDVKLEYKPKNAPKLTFTKLTVHKQLVTKEQLLQQIQEKEKEGFSIKNITISDSSFAEIDKKVFSLNLKKAGTFTIKIFLEKKGFESVTIEATIEYILTEALTFDKLTTTKNTLTKEDILKQVKGNKDGFTIKKIAIDDKNKEFVAVTGTAPDISLTLKKAGDFNATIVLQKPNYTDVTLNGQIEYRPKPTLTFNLITPKTTLTKTELEAQIKGDKNGYTIKDIVVKDKNFAMVHKPAFSLSLKKPGAFSASITLEKPNYFDVTLNASFEGKPEKLTFNKLSTYKNSIPKADILKQIKGGSGGYTIKSIVVNQSAFATVSSDLSLSILKEGDFTANITLQKAGYFDAVIKNAAFKGTSENLHFNVLKTYKKRLTKNDLLTKIQGDKTGYTLTKIELDNNIHADVNPDNSLTLKKGGVFAIKLILEKTGILQKILNGSIAYRPKPTLRFDKLTTSKKTITKADIEKQIKGTTNGYTIAKIFVNDNAFATADNLNFSLNLKKQGSFTATITLQKNNHFDVTLTASFEGKSEKFTFDKLITPKKTITKADIEKQIKENKNGYTIKDIVVNHNSFATVHKPTLSLSLKKTGNFSTLITLGKIGHFDTNALAFFQGRAQNLGFNPLHTTFRTTLTSTTIWAQINGIGKTNYTLKSISNISDDSVAQVQGTGSNSLISLKKAGSFTADFVLESKNYFDVTIPAASFTITKAAPKKLFLNLFQAGYKETFSKEAIFKKITGAKTGYTIQNIDNINPSDAAEFVTTPTPSLRVKKIGLFTATITLTHSSYENAIVTANFKITKGTPKKLTFDTLEIGHKRITSKERILTNVEGEKNGYTFESISDIISSDMAALTGAGLYAQKIGRFTAKIVLKHPLYSNVTITGAQFEIVNKLSAKKLSFRRLTTYKELITQKEILAQIIELTGLTGAPLEKGYTLKKITNIKEISGTGLVALSGLSIKVKKATAIFTADLILQHPNYLDSIITGAHFKREYMLFTFVKKSTSIAIKGIKDEYKDYVKTLKTLTFPSQINGVDVDELSGAGYKTVGGVSGNVNLFGVFENHNIEHVIFPNTLKEIGINVFRGFKKLKSVYFPPNSVKTIRNGAFSYCLLLTSIDLPDALETIGTGAFYNSYNIATVRMPNSVKTIGQAAFHNNRKLTSINLSKSLKTIERAAFYGCNWLTSIDIPQSITTIKHMAFANCLGLTRVTIPNTTHTLTIGQAVFFNCRRAVVIINQPDPSKINLTRDSAGGYPFDSMKEIKVPSGALSTYQTTSPWSRYTSKLKASP